jgi:hypothetical protein
MTRKGHEVHEELATENTKITKGVHAIVEVKQCAFRGALSRRVTCQIYGSTLWKVKSQPPRRTHFSNHWATRTNLAICDEEESSEGKEHIAARPWLELLREHGTKIGDELLTVSFAAKGVEPGPQAGPTVPLNDFIDASQEMEILGRPNVQLTSMWREDIVVELCRMDMPLTRSARESILPSC